MPLRLTFATTDLPRTRLNQMHLHLTSNAASQEETDARVLALGGTHLDVGRLPTTSSWPIPTAASSA